VLLGPRGLLPDADEVVEASDSVATRLGDDAGAFVSSPDAFGTGSATSTLDVDRFESFPGLVTLRRTLVDSDSSGGMALRLFPLPRPTVEAFPLVGELPSVSSSASIDGDAKVSTAVASAVAEDDEAVDTDKDDCEAFFSFFGLAWGDAIGDAARNQRVSARIIIDFLTVVVGKWNHRRGCLCNGSRRTIGLGMERILVLFLLHDRRVHAVCQLLGLRGTGCPTLGGLFFLGAADARVVEEDRRDGIDELIDVVFRRSLAGSSGAVRGTR